LKIAMSYPTREEELVLADRMLGNETPEATLVAGAVEPVISNTDLEELRRTLNEVTVRPELMDYMVDIVRKTRSHESVLVGAGPRATQALLLASRAYAALSDRDFVTPDDVKTLSHAVLAHRIVVRPEFEIEGFTAHDAVDGVLKEVTVPR
jgi:MoxR-like ATPase